jgi:hypothetical protein
MGPKALVAAVGAALLIAGFVAGTQVTEGRSDHGNSNSNSALAGRPGRDASSAPPSSVPASAVRAPTSTVPPAPAITLAAQATGEASYMVKATSLSLTLSAASACWVELRSGSSAGTILFMGTLLPGQSRTLSAGTALWMRMGYPGGITATVDGTPIPLPQVADPFDLSLSSTS